MIKRVLLPQRRPCQIYGLPARRSLLIAQGGVLQACGSRLGLAGAVRNNRQPRVFKGPENATAVGIGAIRRHTLMGRIEVTHLTVASGGTHTSVGGFQFGGFRVSPLGQTALVCTRLSARTGRVMSWAKLLNRVSAATRLEYKFVRVEASLSSSSVRFIAASKAAKPMLVRVVAVFGVSTI